ncbi:MAG: thioredoxin family protein [Candidatus Lokiarchaeota archaeon]|nr:thioredoxin family protein [Candidatus Lokiarchaeota archaeon]
MPIAYVFNKLIRDEMVKLTKPVELSLFMGRNIEDNDNVRSILKIYEESSNELLSIKEVSNPVVSKNYEVNHFPAILFINDKVKEIIRYLAKPFGAEIRPFVETLTIFSGDKNYYEVVIKENIEKIKPSIIKVMITNSCVYCPEIITFVNKFAIASNGKIQSVIIDIMAHSDIAESYDVSSVPYTVINDKKSFIGMVGPEEVLQELIGGDKIV